MRGPTYLSVIGRPHLSLSYREAPPINDVSVFMLLSQLSSSMVAHISIFYLSGHERLKNVFCYFLFFILPIFMINSFKTTVKTNVCFTILVLLALFYYHSLRSAVLKSQSPSSSVTQLIECNVVGVVVGHFSSH